MLFCCVKTGFSESVCFLELGIRNFPQTVATPQHELFGNSDSGIFQLQISVGTLKGAHGGLELEYSTVSLRNTKFLM